MATRTISSTDIETAPMTGKVSELRSLLLGVLRRDGYRPGAAACVVLHAWTSDLRPLVLTRTVVTGVTDDPQRATVVEVATALERRATLVVDALHELRRKRAVSQAVVHMLLDLLDGEDPKTTVAVACVAVILAAHTAVYGG